MRAPVVAFPSAFIQGCLVHRRNGVRKRRATHSMRLQMLKIHAVLLHQVTRELILRSQRPRGHAEQKLDRTILCVSPCKVPRNNVKVPIANSQCFSGHTEQCLRLTINASITLDSSQSQISAPAAHIFNLLMTAR